MGDKKMELEELLAQGKPVHPAELEQAGLKYVVFSHNYEWYKDEDKNAYAFNRNKLDPFLDFYAKFEEADSNE